TPASRATRPRIGETTWQIAGSCISCIACPRRCSEKDDHDGAAHDWAAKERMEFYPRPPAFRNLGGTAAGLIEQLTARSQPTSARSGGAFSVQVGWCSPLIQPEGKLYGHAIEGADHHSRWFSALNGRGRNSIGEVQRFDVGRLSAQQTITQPDFPERVLFVYDILLHGHGLTFRPRRRVQSCSEGAPHQSFCAGRGIGRRLP